MDINVEIKQHVCEFIDKNLSKLSNLSFQIWSNPETAFEEFKSHNTLTNFLQNHGFDVCKATPLPTSFIASSSCKEGEVVVGICCEYDALPVIGHACGHNLIAESSVGAALGS